MEVLPAAETLGNASDQPVRLILSARQVFALISHFEDATRVDELRDALAEQGDEAPTLSSDDVLRELAEAPWRMRRPTETRVTSIDDRGAVSLDGELYAHPALDPFPGRLVRVMLEAQPDVVVVTTLTRSEICRIPVVPNLR